jgi:hypothetical protein
VRRQPAVWGADRSRRGGVFAHTILRRPAWSPGGTGRRSWCGRRTVGTGGGGEVEGVDGAVRGRVEMGMWSVRESGRDL